MATAKKSLKPKISGLGSGNDSQKKGAVTNPSKKGTIIPVALIYIKV